MLYGLLIAIHLIACLILIVVILLQSGRGGGLSETFGGESSQTIFGTKVSVFFTRATVAAAVMFLITSLSLGIMTSRRGRSLIELQRGGALPADATYPQPGEGTETPVSQAGEETGPPASQAGEKTEAPVPAGEEGAPLAETENPTQQ
ncbi:MAG: preprotein translocase subunit SecG [Omnitrophica bacterium RBG_13_46_9]|nr:MAG: preprotein translocase subunit SecG [Omnitrophica bacterium RBG_13_46_9]